ncbi:glycosyltransferase [Synechococcus sp. RS9902]|uniref:glycosyltransferase n=1 Tax=Synechococcus sp. RS9902 TaxID=221345 RepID=UPI0016456DBB|nr:glycosyltransferase [Synechococcus sp. RS9902]QNI96557.1 putative beta-glycosyltransferase/ family 2 [Synechococcus sp. RS9902]
MNITDFSQIKSPLDTNSILPWESSLEQHQQAINEQLRDDFVNVRFSLVIPFYNSGNFLEKTIRSIQYSNLENVEIIVSDGGSSDNTHEILNHYKELFDVVISEPDKGQSDAINKGFACATGELLGWLNGDDLLLPYALDFVRSKYLDLQMPNFMVGDAYMVEKNFSIISHKKYSEESIKFENLLDWATNHLVQPSVFFSKSAWDEVGPLDIHDHYAMDADLFLGLAKKYGAKHLKHPGLSYSVYHPDCKTRGKQAESITQLSIVQCKYGGFKQARKSLDYLVEIHNQYKEAFDNANNTPLEVDTSTDNSSIVKPDSSCESSKSESDQKLSFNIGIFNTFSSGGAAIAASRLRIGLQENSFSAQSYSLFNQTPTKSHALVRPWDSQASPEDLQESWSTKNLGPVYGTHQTTARELFSSTYSSASKEHLIELFDFFDILHFHWVSGLLDYNLLSNIPDNKPIVWTLHDMNPFTGGCHYSENCLNFVEDCSKCHLLKAGSLFAQEQLDIKVSALKRLNNIQVITPSLWLKSLAEQSIVFGGRPVHHIPNIMPTHIFKPHNSAVSRIKLGLPLDKKLLLFGADNITNLRKGGDLLQSVAQLLSEEFSPDDIEVVFFGNGHLNIPFRSHNLGHINDEEKLAYIYSAADLFIFPSREDNAPMSLVESMLCGTPVVASDVGNVSELVKHKSNGYISKSEDISDMCAGIRWLLGLSKMQMSRVRSSCRLVSARYHDESRIIDQLSSVYDSSLSYKNF